MRLKAEGSPDIEIIITSGGGKVGAGLAIFDLLSDYAGKKTIKVFGMAYSMAALILQVGNVRLGCRHSLIMIHHISRDEVKLDDLRRHKAVAGIVADMEKRQERLYAILSQRTGKSRLQVRRASEKAQFMSAEEALEFGLIDAIVDGSITDEQPAQ